MRFLLGIAALVVTASAASAADLAVAPAPVPAAPSWTGLYLGVHAGAAWQNLASASIDDPNGFLASGPRSGGSAMGGLGGLQAGYNWQFSPAWVVGVEGDISWTSLSDQRGGAPALGPNGLPAGPGASATLNANTQWLATARARLGFTGWFNNTMLYVTGGGAWANIEYNATFITTPPLNLANPSQTTTKSGWVAGVGAEWMATTNILLRAEYLYYGIDSSNSLNAVAFPIPAPLPTVARWGSENIQVFRVGGSYKF